jgi:Mg2+ and Co2+ transporter CorA
MTEKELRKLNRYQLLELLMIQTQHVEELEKQLAEVREQLQAQHIRLSNLGSMAEVSAQVSGLLDSAQKAADLYLQAAKEQAALIQQEAAEQAAAIVQAGRQSEEHTNAYEEAP